MVEELDEWLGRRMRLALGDDLLVLANALEAARKISTAYDAEAARAWFASTNPDLGMVSPLRFLRSARTVRELETFRRVAEGDAR